MSILQTPIFDISHLDWLTFLPYGYNSITLNKYEPSIYSQALSDEKVYQFLAQHVDLSIERKFDCFFVFQERIYKIKVKTIKEKHGNKNCIFSCYICLLLSDDENYDTVYHYVTSLKEKTLLDKQIQVCHQTYIIKI